GRPATAGTTRRNPIVIWICSWSGRGREVDEIVRGLAPIRPEPQGLPILFDGLGAVASIFEGDAKIEMCFGKIRFERDGRLVLLDGGSGLSEQPLGVGQIVMGLGKTRGQRDGAGRVPERIGGVARAEKA